MVTCGDLTQRGAPAHEGCTEVPTASPRPLKSVSALSEIQESGRPHREGCQSCKDPNSSTGVLQHSGLSAVRALEVAEAARVWSTCDEAGRANLLTAGGPGTGQFWTRVPKSPHRSAAERTLAPVCAVETGCAPHPWRAALPPAQGGRSAGPVLRNGAGRLPPPRRDLQARCGAPAGTRTSRRHWCSWRWDAA